MVRVKPRGDQQIRRTSRPRHTETAQPTSLAAAAMLAGILAASAIGPRTGPHTGILRLLSAVRRVRRQSIYRDTHGVGESGVMDTARINGINDCQKNGGETGGGHARCASLHTTSAPPSPRQTEQRMEDRHRDLLQPATSGTNALASGGGLIVVSACPS
jgi:hypothetical protein